MSERLTSHHGEKTSEQTREKESLENLATTRRETAPHSKHEKQSKANETLPVGELKQRAESIASAAKELNPDNHNEESSHHSTAAGTELKRHMLARTMVKTRKQLAPPERVLSKVIHQPAIDKLSTAGAKTVARPLGLLSGGICAFVGTSLFLYLAKRYGIPYNWLIVILLMAGGYIVGCLIEIFTRLTRRQKVNT